MRAVFTIGVLDYFMDAGITFPYGIGVSAGAGHGMSYLSRQRGRAKKTAIDLLEKYKYVGLKHLWQSHAIFNQEIIYDRIPNQILPFDYDTAFANPMRFEIVTTNCRTGRAEYHTETRDRERMLTLCKASASLPFVPPSVRSTANRCSTGASPTPSPWSVPSAKDSHAMWWCSRTIAAIATPEVTCASRNSFIKTILACGWRSRT